MRRNDAELQPSQAAEGHEMIEAMRRGVVEALVEHKKAGRSVVTWERTTGEIVHLSPDEIVIPDSTCRPAETST